MDAIRILAQAVGAWLQYEFACGRATLFSERYMSVPIATALHHIFKKQVHSEYLHPVLAPEKTGRGRRPEVDFAVIDKYPALSAVLESKWVGGNGLAADEVLWDLLRLELIASQTRAKAFFVLAGKRKHLDAFFKSKAFLGVAASSGKYRRLLKLDARSNPRVRVDNPAPDRQPIFEKLLRPYQDVSFASRITTSICHRYPLECPMFQYQAYAWEIISPAGTARFLPKNHSAYRAQQAVQPDRA